jgi:hypothetical protein
VRDALITWNDDLRNAPQLVLDRVQFRLHNRFGRYRFGLTGVPPTEIAAPIDVRGDIRGVVANDWQRAVGTLYVRLDYADVAAWREWLPLPVPIDEGALRADGVRGRCARDRCRPRPPTCVHNWATPVVPSFPVAGRRRSSGAAGKFFARGLAVATPKDSSSTQRCEAGLNDAAEAGAGRIEIDRSSRPAARPARDLPLAKDARCLDRFAPRGTLGMSVSLGGRARCAVAFPPPPNLPVSAWPRTVISRHRPFGAEHTPEKGELRIASRCCAELPAVGRDDPRHAGRRAPVGTQFRADHRSDPEAGFCERRFLRQRGRHLSNGTSRARSRRPERAAGACQRRPGAPVRSGRVERGSSQLATHRACAGHGVGCPDQLAGNLAELPFAADKGTSSGHRQGQGRAARLRTARWPAIGGIDADLRIEGRA